MPVLLRGSPRHLHDNLTRPNVGLVTQVRASAANPLLQAVTPYSDYGPPVVRVCGEILQLLGDSQRLHRQSTSGETNISGKNRTYSSDDFSLSWLRLQFKTRVSLFAGCPSDMGESESAIRRDPSRHFPKLKKVVHPSDWGGLSDSLRLYYFKAFCAMPE